VEKKKKKMVVISPWAYGTKFSFYEYQKRLKGMLFGRGQRYA
jgi:hypothetical protein